MEDKLLNDNPQIAPENSQFQPNIKGKTNLARNLLKPRQSMWMILAILVLLLAIVGFLVSRGNDTSKVDTSIYNLTYDKLTSYKLTGKGSGVGISIGVPTQFGLKDGTVSNFPQVSYSQVYDPHGPLPKNYTPVQIAHFALSISPSSFVYSPTFKNSYGQSIETNQSPALKVLQGYVSQRLPAGYSVTASAAKAISTNNLAGNAWEVSYSATASSKKDLKQLPDLNGEVIVAMGKQTTYYVMVDAIASNWQSNQSIWQQVASSIKIDQ